LKNQELAPRSAARKLEELQMTTTFIGIFITAIAIEIDQLTRFKHNALPVIALIGVITIVISLML
jgi:hypothetical protein